MLGLESGAVLQCSEGDELVLVAGNVPSASPDGVPGFAVPFYLAHPRLTRLERKMSGMVEGSNANWQMRILRHEAGHAFDSAYRLRRRARWRALFGHASRRYAS